MSNRSLAIGYRTYQALPSLPAYKRPQNNFSYDTLVWHHNGKFMLFKFQFFRDIENILEGYLKVV